MNEKEILIILNNILMKKAKGISENYEFNSSTNLIKDLNFDSLQMIELMVEIENQFNIEIEEDELIMDNFVDYGQLFDYLLQKCCRNCSKD